MIDVALALDALVPAAQYGGSLTDNTEEAYEAIVWEDERAKPSWSMVRTRKPSPVLELTPMEKLKAFLAANPDVAAEIGA